MWDADKGVLAITPVALFRPLSRSGLLVIAGYIHPDLTAENDVSNTTRNNVWARSLFRLLLPDRVPLSSMLRKFSIHFVNEGVRFSLTTSTRSGIWENSYCIMRDGPQSVRVLCLSFAPVDL